MSGSRLLAALHKEAVQNFRDWKMLSLTLTFAPIFVLLMFGYLRHSAPVYELAVVNLDEPLPAAGGSFAAGDELVVALANLRSSAGDTVLQVRAAAAEEVDALLQSRRADVVVTVPADFSRAIQEYRRGVFTRELPIRSRGDPGNPDYIMAVVWTDMGILEYLERSIGFASPLILESETVTGAGSLTDFELYVPGLLVLALMMIMFTGAGALIREKDSGTLIRLRLSDMSVLEWLTAVTIVQVVVGLLAMGLTLLTAVALGYRPAGSWELLVLVGVLTSLSVMAFSVLVAASLRTVFDLVTVGCFPFFVLMFFSGGMMPLPGVHLFALGGHSVELNEVLPTTHGVTALQKVLSYDAGLAGIAYELAAIVLLSAILFALGTWAFTRRHLPRVG